MMKIDPAHIEALFSQEQAQSRPAVSGDGFGDILAAETAGQLASSLAAMPPLGAAAQFDPRFNLDAIASLSQEETNIALSSLNGLLDELDTYASELSSMRNTHLRDASSRLDSIESRLGAFKADPAAAAFMAGNENFAAVINELEVLATTERIKFNRGDYL